LIGTRGVEGAVSSIGFLTSPSKPAKASGLVEPQASLVEPSVAPLPVYLTGNRPSRAIFSFQNSGASWWTLLPSLSTATVTGMSSTVNS
jgi:hypothetical protein